MRKLGLAVVLATPLAAGFGAFASGALARTPDVAPPLHTTLDIARGTDVVRPDVRQPSRDTGSTRPLASVAPEALPPEARATHQLIFRGGPFPHSKDGTVFGNRERQLPPRPRGQYREYTVRTPGVSHRGARRIVCAGLPPTQPETCYYTADHYTSFRRIAQ